jgi:hypothetical protein
MTNMTNMTSMTSMTSILDTRLTAEERPRDVGKEEVRHELR